ncbi:MAG: DNA repair protein RadC [bacterium]|nr:DNA repair protein RadC [bacterium]
MKMKDIPVSDRPRERFVQYGASSLSNEELLAIILKTGSKKKSAKEVALDLLKMAEGVEKLAEVSKEQLMTLEGIGLTKAIEILSAIELGKRIYTHPRDYHKLRFLNAEQIYDTTKHLFLGQKQECFYCFYLDSKNEILERKLLFMGTINRSLVHPREIFKYAYLSSASSIVCIHNHPSGDVAPSREDIRLTNALVEIGRINSIPVIDHIIVGRDTYYSFYENGNIIDL